MYCVCRICDVFSVSLSEIETRPGGEHTESTVTETGDGDSASAGSEIQPGHVSVGVKGSLA